jgi:hypothetical protein
MPTTAKEVDVETSGRLRSTYHRLTIAYPPRTIDSETNLSVFVKEHDMFWSSGPAFHSFWPDPRDSLRFSLDNRLPVPETSLKDALLDP